MGAAVLLFAVPLGNSASYTAVAAPDRAVGATPEPTNPRAQSAHQRMPGTVGAPGYCPSSGGSVEYESITGVTVTRYSDTTMKLVVQVYIANPTGCTAGEECPEYDDSPEYVNVWIDWDGDKAWEPSERVMDKALTGYLAINYHGTMTAVALFTVPASATQEPTWLRANLGWGDDPNDPCQESWSWGNVVDQSVHKQMPRINSITAEGCKSSQPISPFSCLTGTPGDDPQTGSKVRLQADIEVPSGYEVTRCSWAGDLTPGEGKPDHDCLYEYTPGTGAGPSVSTYGVKDVTLSIAYRHTSSGVTGQVSKNHTYKVFFAKEDDDDGDGEPNWFEYWGDDGAVPGLGAADVEYDQTLGSNTYGYWSPGDDNIHLGGAAAATHYPSGITVPASTDCPGGTFGGARGIDCATEVVAHEGRHKWVHHNWDAGGIWDGWTDSDEGVPSAGYDDDLPDAYEESTTHTATDTVDSCDLETHKSASYKFYGDNEFAVAVYADGRKGNANED